MKARFYRYYQPPGRVRRWMAAHEEQMPWMTAAFWGALCALIVIVAVVVKECAT